MMRPKDAASLLVGSFCVLLVGCFMLLRMTWRSAKSEVINEPEASFQASAAGAKPAVWAVRAKPDGGRQRWQVTGGVNGPPYGVQLEHAALSEQDEAGVVEVWVEGNRIFVHSGNGHELQPRWRSSNFLEIVLVEED